MKWITSATLPAACLALLLAATPAALHAQVVGAAGGAGGAKSGTVPPPGNGGIFAAGGGNSGGGELPKRLAAGEHRPPPHKPPKLTAAPTGPVGGQSGKVGSGSPGGHPLSGARRKLVTAGAGNGAGGGAGGGSRDGRPASATGGPSPAANDTSPGSVAATVTMSVRVVDAAGQPIAGVLLVASDGAGQLLALARTDASGLALLLTPASAPAALQLDAVGGASSGGAVGALDGATLQAGASVLIVLAP